MDLQADIKWIQSELSEVTDPELISAFKSLLQYRKRQKAEEGTQVLWDELDAEQKASIERGLEDAKSGRVKSHEEVMKKYGKWR